MSIKSKLVSLSLASSLAIVPFVASANTVGANVSDATKSAAKSSAQNAAGIVELENGTKVKVAGENVFVLDQNNSNPTPAPDGAHKTKDGQTITTKGGKIVK